MMNRTLKASIAAVLFGTATLAIAQSPAESFADRIRQFQALSGAGPAFKPQPTFSNEPRAAAPRVSIEEFQALSSDAPAFASADNPTFANQAVARGRPVGVHHAAPAASSKTN
jgi:hypothetical protein